MKTRKIYSLAMASVLALTLTSPASAEDEFLPEPNAIEGEFDIGASPEPDTAPILDDSPQILDDVMEPDDFQQIPDDLMEPDDFQQISNDVEEAKDDIIKVVVPAVGNVMLNPYGMSVETDTGETREQVVHQAQPIMNYSDFPVAVNATVTGSLASDAWFVTEPPFPNARDKEMFLYVEFQNSSDNWVGDYMNLPNQLLVTEEERTEDSVMVLDAESEGYFRLFGSMSTRPVSMWTADNELTVTITYTFLPENSLLAEPDEWPVEEDLETPEELEPPIELEMPEEPEDPVEPEEPEDPVEPETPEETEDPVEPETPEEPEDPVEPETPEETEDPVELETPEETEDPVEPEPPEETEDFVEPEESEPPAVPEILEEPEEAGTPETPAEPEETAVQEAFGASEEGGEPEISVEADETV